MPAQNDRVTAVIPCLNEESALRTLLPTMPADWSVLVVDNGSTDRTAEVARAHGAEVVTEHRPGYGSAVHRGLETVGHGVVVVLDGDGSIDPNEIAPLVAALETHDLVCGTRVPTRGSWSAFARYGNRTLAAVLGLALGVRLTDLAPVRVSRAEALLGLGITDRACGYPIETLIRAANAGWRLTELPLTYHPRTGGVSKVSGSVRGTLRAIRDFARVLGTHRTLLTGPRSSTLRSTR